MAPSEDRGYDALLVDHLAFIDGVVRAIARRHNLPHAEAEDLASAVRLKLVADDYDVLRQFEGRSSLHTYLRVVIQRVFLDERRTAWGTWRPSAQARRLGPTAVLLERVLVRDGFPFEAAVRALRGCGVTLDDDALAALAAQLPSRVRRRFVDMSEADAVADASGPALDPQLEASTEDDGARAEAAIERALAELPPEERLVLRLHFMEGLRLSHVARLLRLDQKPLYKRVERALRTLRRALESMGVGPDRIEVIVKTSDFDLVRAFGEGSSTGNAGRRPSLLTEARATTGDTGVRNG